MGGSIGKRAGKNRRLFFRAWENEQNITVRILKVNAAIASVEGIIDVQNTALNGREENLLLDPNAIPVRGVILCKQ